MKNTEFIPADFDAHGRLRLPLLFWCVLLLQARTWVLFLMAGASRQQGDAILNLFYPDHERFWLGLLPGVPAVLAYYDKFIRKVNSNSLARYMLVASAIGSLYKMNASISGAEVGCQGEVGVACSMAAAGLAELLGGSPGQVCIAAEIAMEHNLGLTCDPVAGQVQVPCIERNAIAAVKAVNAARMALRRTSEPRVCLDKVIETMYETGKDMNAKYRETSRGGLAMKIVACD